ncbi:bacteriohemerythrin [Thermodesulfobacteriota bacterium]
MAQFMRWNRRMSVHVEKIDDQHKELISHINEVFGAVLEGKGAAEVTKVTGFLISYTKFHFWVEESYMRQYKYPEYDSHKKEHEELAAAVVKLKEQIAGEGIDSQTVIEVVKKLGEWTGQHIGKMDAALGAFLKDKLPKSERA